MTGEERRRVATQHVRYLAGLGWGVEYIAEELGWNKNTVSRIRSATRHSTIAPHRLLELSRLVTELEQIENDTPAGAQVRAHARRQGWLP